MNWPNRMLRPGILTSPAVNQLSSGAELFLRRLMSAVDDFGFCEAYPWKLRKACYPLRPTVTDDHVAAWLAECVAAGVVALFVDARDRECLRIEKWKPPRHAISTRHMPKTVSCSTTRQEAPAKLPAAEPPPPPAIAPEPAQEPPPAPVAKPVTAIEECVENILTMAPADEPPPELSECIARGEMAGVPPDFTTKWHGEMTEQGWRDNQGRPCAFRWLPMLKRYWENERARINERREKARKEFTKQIGDEW